MSFNEEIARGVLQLEVQLDNRQIADKVNAISDVIKNRLSAEATRMGQNLSGAALEGATGLAKLQVGARLLGDTLKNSVGKSAKAVGTTLAGVATIGAAGFAAIATKAIRAGVAFNVLQQNLRGALKTILGSSTAAEGLLAQVNKLNDTSPFPRSVFMQATQQLVGFGVKAEEVVPILDAVQQAASAIGNKDAYLPFIQGFARIKSAGKITGETLQIFAEKGIDVATILGKEFGKTGQEIKDEISKGAIDADKAIAGLTKGLQTRFGGSTENLADSFETAKDSIQGKLRDIGAALTRVFINPQGGGAAVMMMNNISAGLRILRGDVNQVTGAISGPLSALEAPLRALAEFGMKASAAFVKFASSLKADQITRILEIFKMLAPAVAFFGTSLTQTLTQNIPVVGRLVGAFNPVVLAIGLLVASVPELRATFNSLMESLRPVAEAALPLLETTVGNIQKGFALLSPIIIAVVEAIKLVAAVVGPLLRLMNFGPINMLLVALVAKFYLGRLAAKAFAKDASTGIGLAVSGIRQLIASLTTATGAANGTAAAVAKIGPAGASAGRTAGQAGPGFHNPMTKGPVPGWSPSGTAAAADAATASTSKLSGALSKAGNIGKNAFAGMAAGLRGLISPQTIAITLTLHLANVIMKAKAAATEFAAEFRLSDSFKGIGDIDESLKATTKELEKQKDLAGKGVSVGAFGVKLFSNDDAKEAQDKVDALQKQKDAMEENLVMGKKFESQAGEQVRKNLGLNKSTAEINEKAQELGITYDSLNSQMDIDSASKKIVDAFGDQSVAIEAARVQMEKLKETFSAVDSVAAANKGVASAQAGLADLKKRLADMQGPKAAKAIARSVADAAKGVTEAQKGLTEARKSAVEATARLNELESKRAKLLEDTGAGAREVRAAEIELINVRQSLLDLDQQEADIQRDLADLADEGPDKVAAADRAIERAKIALNAALREEKELNEEVVKTQTAGLNLTGLTIDQIKSRLSNVRASLAAQKSLNDAVADKDDDKSAAQIEDEKLTARLNSVEAEQALKEAVEARGDIEIDLGIEKRELEENLVSLTLNREQSLERQRAISEELVTLRAGDTAHARELKTIDDEIKTAKEGQADAAERIRGAEEGVTAAREAQAGLAEAAAEREAAQRDVVTQIRAAEEAVRDAKWAQREAVAAMLGDEKATNRVLVERLALNADIISQLAPVEQQAFAKKFLENLLGPVVQISGVPTPGLLRDKQTNDLLRVLGNPTQLLAFLSSLGMNLAQGGILSRATFATIGEAGREVVLPLTRPARMAELVGNPLVLPPILQALGRVTLPQVRGASALNLNGPATAGAGGRPTLRRGDGPMTYDQAQEMIRLLKEHKTEVTVEAPIQLSTPVQDPNLVARKIRREIENKIGRF